MHPHIHVLPHPRRHTSLNNGMRFDSASFGLQVYDDDTAKAYTLLAIQVGCSHLVDVPQNAFALESQNLPSGSIFSPLSPRLNVLVKRHCQRASTEQLAPS
jgi:hypothetical protein